MNELQKLRALQGQLRALLVEMEEATRAALDGETSVTSREIDWVVEHHCPGPGMPDVGLVTSHWHDRVMGCLYPNLLVSRAIYHWSFGEMKRVDPELWEAIRTQRELDALNAMFPREGARQGDGA